ncbi:MAG: type II toxin-antitoxin system RelE/ParE family toxin [Mesorhizobium sp.]|nr:type II toxin-antitoxin system RelE/ParE family toxin [Mesorhizobium sp.]
MPDRPDQLRPLKWVGSSRRDYADFPDEVQEAFGFELYLAQIGEHPPSAKPLRGMGGVIELVEDHQGDTFRTVYLARFEMAVYVLHCFKKKSKSGIATPQHEIELVRARLRTAEADASVLKDKTR